MIADSQSSLKVCYACGTAQPVDQFRYRKRRSPARQGICRTCYNAYMRDYRRARRSKRLRQFAAQLRRAGSPQRVSGLVAGMAAHFGGLDRLCAEWASSLRVATPSAALRAFGVIAHLGEVAGFGQQPDVDTLTDEELKEEVLRNTEALIVSEPELAVLVAQQIGWTVIPPG